MLFELIFLLPFEGSDLPFLPLSRLVLAYSPQRDKLVLYAAGSNGILECERMLDAVGEEVAYALVRTEDEGGDEKVAFVTYVGEGVG